MTFDLISFIAGLAAGVLVGALAGYLHETEMIGELQERVRTAMVQFERITSLPHNKRGETAVGSDLRKELLELQSEIRKLYRRQDR